MSGTASGWALKVRGIRPGSKLILQLLCAHHNYKTGQCNPSINLLCECSDMARSTVLGHLAKLEGAGFITRETKALGRGRGKVTNFTLNMDVLEAKKATKNDNCDEDLQVQISRRLDFKTSSQPDLEVQIAGPAYNKDEPERNRNTISGKDALDEIWAMWSPEGRKRSDAKDKLAKRFEKLGKSHDLEQVVRVFVDMAKKTDPKYHRGIQVELNSGRWQNWTDEASSPDQQRSQTDWQKVADNFLTLDFWPHPLGPPPDQVGCKAPKETLQYIADKLQGDRRHFMVMTNVEAATQ